MLLLAPLLLTTTPPVKFTLLHHTLHPALRLVELFREGCRQQVGLNHGHGLEIWRASSVRVKMSILAQLRKFRF